MDMPNKAYKFRLYPTKEQEQLLAKTFGCVRFVYNKMLEERKQIFEKFKDDKEALKQHKFPTPAKYKRDFPWLKEVDSLALANAQLNLQKAFTNFFSYEHQPVPKEIENVVGLDFSMNTLYVDSEGKRANDPRFYRQALEKLARILHFGQSVHDNGWGMFTSFLQYKLAEQGKKLIKIDKWFPSSKMCSCCGRVKVSLSLSELLFCCECGFVADRDTNAAINIKKEGLKQLGTA
ncbi:transposase [Caldalkalibacillus thermarum TA2.A1]|uniref:Transposase n=1 Tax=Caldalkalibacillus thermarum (strain TA2.A1) TaxID=986075 RepID=A0A8X8I4Z7_CALTT|nr:helix-turn-helix domain-containing protein [Caldalkalibacillus thermarum]QZT34371.1 transposase [Caldalkalibacillus thermarum TA2.A1]